MFRISKHISKLEDRIERKAGRWLDKNREKLAGYLPLILVALYFYGMLINSIRLGTAQVFAEPGAEPIKSIWVVNPVKNLAALFSPTGLAVSFFCGVMAAIITKKGYNWLSGYKCVRDPRGFDVLPDGTHGTGGWMSRREMEGVLERGPIAQLEDTVLGKLKEDADDSDQYAEYVCLKADSPLNRHIIVLGASGAGKSRGFVRPFAFQAAKKRESLVLVDPKAELYESMAGFLEDQGYTVRVFNLLDMANSDAWNCIQDIEQDGGLVQSVAETIIKNTSNANERQDFWEKAEMNLLCALLHYVQLLDDPRTGKRLPIEERSLGTIYHMLSGESFNQLEDRFAQLPPSHPAQAPYGIFKLANRQIWGNIAIGLGNRLGVYQNQLVDTITKYNSIDMELPGQRPCAYFCVISDSDSSLEFLSSMFFTMLFARLSNYARRHGQNGRLPVPVNMVLDEFCNIGKIADFKKLISTVRSRGINCQVVIQSVAQLSDRYEHKEWEEIIGNCDSQIFLGGNDQMTAEYISDKCGQLTIRTTSNSMPLQPLFSPIYSTTRPYSQTRSNAQRPLMYPDEVLRLDNRKCLVLLRGQKPLQLYKVIPEEFPAFCQLRPVRIPSTCPNGGRLRRAKQQQNPPKRKLSSRKSSKPRRPLRSLSGITGRIWRRSRRAVKAQKKPLRPLGPMSPGRRRG